MITMHSTDTAVACINGVALHLAGDAVSAEDLRQRACSELLRQEAVAQGLLDAADCATPDGLLSEQASLAIEQLLEQSVHVPEPTPEDCRRYYAAHPKSYTRGEKVMVRHILFAVTQGVDMPALIKRAESILLNVRCHDGTTPVDGFEEYAKTLSNCPSGADGGYLGWLTMDDCAPELGKEIFGQPEVGVLPRLVRSRYGLHVVEVLERQAGALLPFEAVQAAVLVTLRQQAFMTAMRHYLSQLAQRAVVHSLDLQLASGELLQ
jgi:peptidyl-prolyl cis-trans isomerase C